ncbi:Os03g0262300 [Oryza sativa Japonica Group]|uniref:Os03g0262300 protein n=1 Tax=Oryza sativa subsp. japonica TaxID=39947 RepID=Q0DT97_ORYSJ|nr:Os03g0262300 [Oryza sativa Japonica Group]|eukprot:NP_001049627.2 Os03g0262300 [Oryza sativa Japonica Group]
MNGRSCQDGSDTDYSEDASDYENVLLITGPVGLNMPKTVVFPFLPHNKLLAQTLDLKPDKLHDSSHPSIKYIPTRVFVHMNRNSIISISAHSRLNKCLSCPSLLDLDAVHSTVPRIMPWDFPCKLSETIYMEIDKTIVTAEQKKKQMEVSEFEGLELQIMTPLTKGRSAGKTRKPKKSKLKHGRSADCNDASPCKNDLDDFHDSPDIPLPSNHQRMRNRRGVVLFAESDDDLADAHAAKDATFTVQEGRLLPQSSELPCLYGHGISNIVPESVFFQQSSVPHLHREVISNQLCFPSESRAFEPASSFQNQLESNMPGSISQICDTFMSQGISCVPESSFMVGGTSASISSDDLLSSLVSNGLSALRNESTYTASVVALEDTNKVENQMTDKPQKCMEDEVGETCEAYVELADRNDHASCSITGYQLMDECSRAESVWLLSGKKNNDSCKVEHVQDTWNRLRQCHPVLPCDMNHNRSVSGALKRVSRVSDLISESDLMLISCHPFSNVSVFLSLLRFMFL